MVDIVQVVSAVASFTPALALLYFTLRDYTFPKVDKPFFDDKKVFAFFALGIVLGTVVFVFESWEESIISAESLLAVILGFALVEELMKLVILNFPRFQRKVDTAFYGLSMGLGLSATLAFSKVYSSSFELAEPESSNLLPFALSSALLSIQVVLLHGSTTALIGIGSVRRDIKGYFSEALLIHLGYSLMMLPTAFAEDSGDILSLLGIAAATAIVVYGYRKVHVVSLPALIRDAKRLAKNK